MLKSNPVGWWSAMAVLATFAIAPGANADPLPFTPTLTIGSTPLVNDDVLANPDGSYTLIGDQQGGPTGGPLAWDMSWNLTVSQDPFINGAITLTNLTTSTKTYNLLLSLPVTPAFAPSLYGGSITATVLDLNGDLGATLAPVGASIYRGAIDSSPVLFLFGANLTCTASGPGCTATGSDSDGLPGPALPGPGVATSIATLLNFTLSAGDRVVIDTNFTVEPPPSVPLPAALPLMLLGLGTLVAKSGLRDARSPLAA